ncbi:DUF2304 domain-containing protein [Enorma phocaeensis]|uniref:DUF2304 domain-containing protein n=1 Tax=Enorma phocaeensis TaxID=1871019 RepID=UPI002352C423|nr:DUF2304 domain-containing protein [Enorma phocaeensis]
MLPLPLRAMLILGAILALGVVAKQVKKDKILIEDAVFWVVVAAVFVALALFPGIAITLAYQLGFMSASNFVYLAVIVLLLWKVFTNSAEISRLKARINELAQEVALSALDKRDADDKK